MTTELNYCLLFATYELFELDDDDDEATTIELSNGDCCCIANSIVRILQLVINSVLQNMDHCVTTAPQPCHVMKSSPLTSLRLWSTND